MHFLANRHFKIEKGLVINNSNTIAVVCQMVQEVHCSVADKVRRAFGKAK
jgi:hypothetical protein